MNKIVPLQVDARGVRTRPGLDRVLDSEVLREDVGSLSIPYGQCVEPSNVRSHGRSCAFRYQCFGCTHFRTDPSYLPELREHLARRLSDIEVLAATDAVTDWALDAARRRDEELAAVRNLIRVCEAELDELGSTDRALVKHAIARHAPGAEGPRRGDAVRSAAACPAGRPGAVPRGHPGPSGRTVHGELRCRRVAPRRMPPTVADASTTNRSTVPSSGSSISRLLGVRCSPSRPLRAGRAWTDDARRSSVESAARVTTATLRADLANEREFNRRLRTQVTALEARLSELLGQLVLADLPDTTRAAITGDRQQQQVDDLEHVVFQLREELRRRDEELDGVRRANRELTRRLNARHVDGPASDPAQP